MRLATIAITGGIAEGKSTVLGYLRDAGHSTVSSDAVAAQLLAEPALGLAVAQATGLTFPLDRAALRDRLVADVTVRRAVNAILHAPIIEAIARANAEFAEVPLLVEACLQDFFSAVWVVTCGQEAQFERLIARSGSEAAAAAILSTQLHQDAKLAFADVVIRTNTGAERVKDSTLEAASGAIKTLRA